MRMGSLSKQAVERGAVDPLLLIATYIFDFLCIHPFIDGNGRMSRLLTLYYFMILAMKSAIISV